MVFGWPLEAGVPINALVWGSAALMVACAWPMGALLVRCGPPPHA